MCCNERLYVSCPIFGSPVAGAPVRRGGALARRPATAGPGARRDPEANTHKFEAVVRGTFTALQLENVAKEIFLKKDFSPTTF